MTCEWQLDVRRKDAEPRDCTRINRRQNEDTFGEIHFPCDGLHLGG
jgi:hypothetical protein